MCSFLVYTSNSGSLAHSTGSTAKVDSLFNHNDKVNLTAGNGGASLSGF